MSDQGYDIRERSATAQTTMTKRAYMDLCGKGSITVLLFIFVLAIFSTEFQQLTLGEALETIDALASLLRDYKRAVNTLFPESASSPLHFWTRVEPDGKVRTFGVLLGMNMSRQEEGFGDGREQIETETRSLGMAVWEYKSADIELERVRTEQCCITVETVRNRKIPIMHHQRSIHPCHCSVFTYSH